MSETTPQPETDTQGSAPQQATPVVRVVSQYVKDLSFENPNAPIAVQTVGPKPDVQLEVNLGARPMGPDFPMGKDFYEIEMSVSATAKEKDSETIQYVVETNYAGLMAIQNVPEEHMGAVLLVEGPQLLFPFARQVIADAVRNGGFTPLMLEPLDFAGMYRQQLVQQQQQAAQAGAADSSAPEVGNA
jgi:preprotein translocase subunit SecB